MNLYDEEGNAAELKFGPEFSEDVQCLMTDEVYVLLDKQKKVYDSKGITPNETFKLSHSYVSRIAATNDTEILRGVANELRIGLDTLELREKETGVMSHLHKFEVAHMASLMPPDCTVEEALAWIPSLARFEEISVEQALGLITTAKSRILVEE